MPMRAMLDHVRSALFLPASNPRAIAKARSLAADLVILDLEDSVGHADKDVALAAALKAAEFDGWPNSILSIRINGEQPWHDVDVDAIAGRWEIGLVVVPKVEDAAYLEGLHRRLGTPLLPMIETPAGIYAAREIAAAKGVVGLLAGSNDLAASLGVPSGRFGLALALQMIVLAARAAGIVPLDGVFNGLHDPEGFERDCLLGRSMGFSGKSLIHPDQIDAANRIFGPDAGEIEEARALVAAATEGAVRFRGRMVEQMHVDAARRLLERAGPA
jgi:(3S)-malyl-CoA thioesterase